MRILFTAISLLLASFVSNAAVDLSDPNQVVHLVSENTFARLNTEKERLKREPSYIKVVIEEELLPYIDYTYAAYKVMGRHLKKTSKAQRIGFVNAFKTYLVNVYGHMLFKFDQHKLEILDNAHFKDKSIITIAVKIVDVNMKQTQIKFKLRKNKKEQQWKVFDVIAEGISMLNTKQSELNDLFQEKGIDHVIELLNRKNSEFSS